MTAAVVVDAVRSPIGKGKPGGALSSLHAVELLSQVLKALVDRTGIDPGIVEDVLVGCVSQAADQAGCPGRAAWLAFGGPDHVPSATIDRRCGSSQQSLSFAAQAVISGAQDVVIAAGVESMSRVPMGSARLGADPFGPSLAARYAPGMVPQGISAELIAAQWKISREEMDAFAARSHQRAATAWDEGWFNDEVVLIDLESGTFERDETIRPSTTADSLSALKPSFESEEFFQRYPEISWAVTAGNASQLADGASAALVMAEEKAARLGLEPIARIHTSVVCGSDPILMLTGPIPATERVLERSGLSIDEIDLIEINEAFASVPLAWSREFPAVEHDRINPAGGAIALGHPLGASGTRLLATMVHGLVRGGGRYGLQVMCEGSGMANATIVENLRH
jgi:acetyl-CoA acetyltransferase family protein